MLQTRGFALIVSAPSGTGKTTLTRHLMATQPNIALSVSTTTRGARPGEEEGTHYFFVDKNRFETRIEQGCFLEWAEVFGNYYGTDRGFVKEHIEAGHVVLLDIDWQGARQIRDNMDAHDVVSIFIAPPAQDKLEIRLRGRKTDSEEVIQKRMQQAAAEFSHWDEFDYVVVNDDLAQAKVELSAVLVAERLRRGRMQATIQPILKTFA
ncbi:guanylate kinase [Magnetococcus marinus MC-1]|uniref:Guanylate kinase n=1 Tax=Magnetococcus marinus (strain ATCC BAA-1437 / JCM 17883 / MC-1) TaxID=156889 RepID=A0L485_MAGMM|nr:guanylate kinase [Magnetococcus marinus]ABK42778.1 guanylate kinase [Magnetococcus marinus MC-1]